MAQLVFNMNRKDGIMQGVGSFSIWFMIRTEPVLKSATQTAVNYLKRKRLSSFLLRVA